MDGCIYRIGGRNYPNTFSYLRHSAKQFYKLFYANIHFLVNKFLNGTLTKSEDPDEMPHNAAFHQSLRCLLRHNGPSKIEIGCFHFEIMTKNHPDFIVCCFYENSMV